MTSAEDVARNIRFDKNTTPNLVSYSILNNANGDEWKEIKLVFNGADSDVEVRIPKGDWIVIAYDGKIDHNGIKDGSGKIFEMKDGKTMVPHRSALILAKKK